MKMSEKIDAYAKAFAQAQREVKQPLKDKDNPFFKSKYVPLENVADAITESFGKHGLSYSQDPQMSETGNIEVSTLVMHESGQWILYGPISLKPVKSDPQAAGSAITYAKRYALSAIFGITSDEDDDGNEATQPQQRTQPQRNNSAKPTQATQQRAQEKRITIAEADRLKGEIHAIAESKGGEQGKVTAWFLKHLGVADYKQILQEQLELADSLIKQLKESEK